ncbi:tyrosine-type recombinase/integrase [Lysobacter changpingensis]|uniref:tyrosine-type recombinase/integrase n=1 Tax=Lysobacter changpingensis TaxID=2792784 RepID=UPI001A8C7FB5|nr:site-specific integrase [Lysobacter changpingensis]
MAKTTHLLSDIQIKRWIAKGEPVAKSDGDGLTFTLSASGTAAWVLRFRIGGRRKELTLGSYPDIGLAAAREKARAHRAAIDEGRDPAAEKQERKTRAMAAWTMRDLVDDYREKCLTDASLAPGTRKYREYDLKGVVLPRLGSREVQRITTTDIVSVLIDIRRTWTITRRVKTTLSQLFDHAIALSIVSSNPCAGIKLNALKGNRPPVRKRVMLSEDELRTLLPSIEETIGLENALAFRILLATCVRTAELVKAKKADIDLDREEWWVPDENVKTRTGFLVPLTPTVAGWFRELIELSGGSEYLLPARQERRRRNVGGDTHVAGTTLWAAITRAFGRKEIEIRKFTPHDTRSTAKGHMRSMGVSQEISEVALNHVLKGMDRVYDVRSEIPERREALEKWANFIVACEKGEPSPAATSNVIAFRPAA